MKLFELFARQKYIYKTRHHGYFLDILSISSHNGHFLDRKMNHAYTREENLGCVYIYCTAQCTPSLYADRSQFANKITK